MKTTILFALLCSVACMSHSQIKVNSTGNVAMGGGDALETLSNAQNQDSLTALTVYGYGGKGAGGRIAFGNPATSSTLIGKGLEDMQAIRNIEITGFDPENINRDAKPINNHE